MRQTGAVREPDEILPPEGGSRLDQMRRDLKKLHDMVDAWERQQENIAKMQMLQRALEHITAKE